MASPANIEVDHLLQLASQLQTSLDVEDLVAIFNAHLGAQESELGHVQGVRFTNAQAGIESMDGDDGPHRFDVALVLARVSLGELGVFSARKLSASQEKKVEALAAYLLHPLRNALMYREAINASVRDPLTGVNNRTSFRKVLDREVELSHRHGAPLSLIMLDVDRFKTINDMHGHMVGDLALKSIAKCLVACIRDSDILFRYGGEEFCIALANTSLAGARKLAERVRRALEILVVRTSGTRVHVTASFGVATLEEKDDAAQLVEKADHSLYRAKELGRNRIATHEDSAERQANR